MSSTYIGVKEMRAQVLGTICNGARTKNAIKTTQTPGYVRAFAHCCFQRLLDKCILLFAMWNAGEHCLRNISSTRELLLPVFFNYYYKRWQNDYICSPARPVVPFPGPARNTIFNFRPVWAHKNLLSSKRRLTT